SRTGWIHTDYCSGWFDESAARPGTIIFPDRASCGYFDGRPRMPGVQPEEYIRAGTAIFYLCNDGWQPGDGGETALYSGPRFDSASVLVPPANNSLVLFECHPRSHHCFLTNPGRRRNSIIMWLHSTVADAETRWGPTGLHRRRSS